MLSRWQSTIVDAKGNIQPGAVLRILNERDQTLALVYQTNNDLQPYPLGYVTANANGFAYFYAAPGRYRIQSIDLDIDWRDVEIGGLAVARAALENSGMLIYNTQAEMQADTPTESPVYARVVNDVDPELNGYYIWDGSAWSRTTEQPADADKVLRSDIPQSAPLLSIPQSGVVELPFALDALRTATRNLLYGDGPYPTLDLRFSGATLLDPRIDFTRASTATYTDAMGVVRTAEVDEPRFDYDPATGKSLGVLIEPEATNLLLNSEVVVDQTIIVPSGNITLSFYGEGVISFTGAATGTLQGAGGNDRAVGTVTATAGELVLSVTDGSPSLGQLEVGSPSSTYIPTIDSPVTRAADNMSRSLGAEFNPDEGTIFVEYESPIDVSRTYGRDGGLLFRLFGNGSGGLGSRNQFVAGRFQGNLHYAFRDVDGTGLDDIGLYGPSLPYGQKNKIAICYNSGVGFISAVNGSTVPHAFPELPSVNWETMNLTTAYDGTTFLGHKSVVSYYPVAMTEAQLEALTAL